MMYRAENGAVVTVMQTLERLYDERPGVFLNMMRFLAEPPEVGEIVVRFRDGKLSGAESKTSFQ